MERRSFLKLTAALSASATVVGCSSFSKETSALADPQLVAGEQLNWSACLVNCGSNCPIKVYSKDGVITRIDTDSTGADQYGINHQIRACTRGRALRQRNYAPDRLTAPMKLVGEKGVGKGAYQKISWDEAFSIIKQELDKREKDEIYMHYGTGAYYGFASNTSTWARLLNMTKQGFLNHHWDYSWAGVYAAAMASYGFQWESISGTSLSEIEHSDLFIGFGFNPNEIRMSGSGEGYDFVKAVEKARIKHANFDMYLIEPRYTDSMRGQESKWLAIRPGTDAALVEALIYEMIKAGFVAQGTEARQFLDKYVVGFDAASLEKTKAELSANADPFIAQHARYINPRENYHDYILGQNHYRSQGARTPQWAAKITGVPAQDIQDLAKRLMQAKAPYISAGAGISRHANGDQATRAVYTLAIMTGKIGQQGVNNGAMPLSHGFGMGGMPTGTNTVDVTIPVYTWFEAVTRGKDFTGTTDGVRYSAHQGNDRVDHNTARLNKNVSMIINAAGNALVNQHSDSNGSAAMLKNNKDLFVVVCDCWETPSSRYADLILPDTTWLESEDLADDSYASGQMAYATFMSSSLKPHVDAKSMYDICSGIAEKMGVGQQYTEGRDTRAWCEHLYEQNRQSHQGYNLPKTLAEAQKQGVYKKFGQGATALAGFIADPINNPLQTVSGKIEIFSLSLAHKRATWTLRQGDQITPLPQYVITWDGFEDQDAIQAGYDLQLCGFHTKGRTHSSYHNVPWLREAVEDAVWLNPADAISRGIQDGDKVQVYNARGCVEIIAKVTPRVIPGVAMMGQGAWYTPVERQGKLIDIGGCLNTLTKYHPSPITKGNPQHTNRVAIIKA